MSDTPELLQFRMRARCAAHMTLSAIGVLGLLILLLGLGISFLNTLRTDIPFSADMFLLSVLLLPAIPSGFALLHGIFNRLATRDLIQLAQIRAEKGQSADPRTSEITLNGPMMFEHLRVWGPRFCAVLLACLTASAALALNQLHAHPFWENLTPTPFQLALLCGIILVEFVLLSWTRLARYWPGMHVLSATATFAVPGLFAVCGLALSGYAAHFFGCFLPMARAVELLLFLAGLELILRLFADFFRPQTEVRAADRLLIFPATLAVWVYPIETLRRAEAFLRYQTGESRLLAAWPRLLIPFCGAFILVCGLFFLFRTADPATLNPPSSGIFRPTGHPLPIWDPNAPGLTLGYVYSAGNGADVYALQTADSANAPRIRVARTYAELLQKDAVTAALPFTYALNRRNVEAFTEYEARRAADRLRSPRIQVSKSEAALRAIKAETTAEIAWIRTQEQAEIAARGAVAWQRIPLSLRPFYAFDARCAAFESFRGETLLRLTPSSDSLLRLRIEPAEAPLFSGKHDSTLFMETLQ